MTVLDCAIIGAGPAGVASALECARQGLSFVIYERAMVGGQALAANLIENFPGHPSGISGRALMQRFAAQLEAAKIKVVREEVTSVKKSGAAFIIKTARGESSSRAVIVACGLAPKRLGIPGEDLLLCRRIFAYADPAAIEHAEKRVLIIGSGDAAFDIAIGFSSKAKSVAIAMKHDRPACTARLLLRAQNAGIEILPKHLAHSIQETAGGIEIKFACGSILKLVEADLAVPCIGKIPRTDFIHPKLLIPDAAGIYFAGDCRRGNPRHIAVACGDGVVMMMKAAEYLKR